MLYEYDRHDWQTVYRVRMWTTEESGLPAKSRWKEIEPNIIHNERNMTYFFDSDIREPN
jgi:hypothetical protein